MEKQEEREEEVEEEGTNDLFYVLLEDLFLAARVKKRLNRSCEPARRSSLVDVTVLDESRPGYLLVTVEKYRVLATVENATMIAMETLAETPFAQLEATGLALATYASWSSHAQSLACGSLNG